MSPKELELLTWKGNSIKKVSMTPAPLFDIGVQQILHAFTPRSYFHGAVTCIDLGISSVSSCPPVTVVHTQEFDVFTTPRITESVPSCLLWWGLVKATWSTRTISSSMMLLLLQCVWQTGTHLYTYVFAINTINTWGVGGSRGCKPRYTGY